MNQKESFSPSIRTRSGETYYPTGDEWLLFFAIKGCEWAKKAIENKLKGEDNEQSKRI